MKNVFREYKNMPLQVITRETQEKIVMTYKNIFLRLYSYGAQARVRDGSGKPTAWVGVVGKKGEDLERTARAAGNAHICSIDKNN